MDGFVSMALGGLLGDCMFGWIDGLYADGWMDGWMDEYSKTEVPLNR